MYINKFVNNLNQFLKNGQELNLEQAISVEGIKTIDKDITPGTIRHEQLYGRILANFQETEVAHLIKSLLKQRHVQTTSQISNFPTINVLHHKTFETPIKSEMRLRCPVIATIQQQIEVFASKKKKPKGINIKKNKCHDLTMI